MVNPNLESYLLPNYARFIPRRSLPISNQSPHQVSQPPNSNTPSSLTPHPTSQLLPSHPPSTPSSHPLIPCPSPSEFSNALDLPHQRASHQNPNFLNAQFKRGCRCQWSVKQDEGRIEGLLCDFTAHYYHRSKTGAVVRGPLDPSLHTLLILRRLFLQLLLTLHPMIQLHLHFLPSNSILSQSPGLVSIFTSPAHRRSAQRPILHLHLLIRPSDHPTISLFSLPSSGYLNPIALIHPKCLASFPS